MKKIDKSVFTAEELAQYEALIAKGLVEEDESGLLDDDEPTTNNPTEKGCGGKKPTEKGCGGKKSTSKACGEDMVETAKSAVAPELAAALERMESLAKSLEMKEFAEIAKKYAPLGENEEDLAKSLYEMKKSSEDNYNAYIGILDKSLAMVEKSGVFSEIGKSASGTNGTVIDKVEAAADEIMKSDAGMSRAEAIAKAWTDNPEFVAEYEKEYNA